MKASPRTHAAVQATLQQWKDAYSQRTWTARWQLSPPMMMWSASALAQTSGGSDPEEVKAQLERDFAQSEALSVDYQPLVVSEAGPVAWVAGRVTVQARVEGQELSLTGRFTAVLEQRGDRWLLGADPLLAPGRRAGRGPILLVAAGLKPKGTTLQVGPRWGRETADNNSHSRSPADNQPVADRYFGRDGAVGPYMACKGSSVSSRASVFDLQPRNLGRWTKP